MTTYCNYCNTVINGTYRTYQVSKRVICDHCFNTVSKCSKCNIPLQHDESKIHDNNSYCVKCFSSLKICSHCQKAVNGTFYEYESIILCDKCNSLSKCNVCQRPQKRDVSIIEINENEFICEICRPESVLDSETLKEVFRTAIILLNKLFDIKIKKLRTVKIISKSEMVRKGRSLSPDNNLSPFDVSGIASSDGDIYVCCGESKTRVLKTIIHELGHIWQFENWDNYDGMEPYQKEGFCNWLSYKSLLHLNKTFFADEMLENTDKIYGRGLRYFLKVERDVSKEKIIQGNFSRREKYSRM